MSLLKLSSKRGSSSKRLISTRSDKNSFIKEFPTLREYTENAQLKKNVSPSTEVDLQNQLNIYIQDSFRQYNMDQSEELKGLFKKEDEYVNFDNRWAKKYKDDTVLEKKKCRKWNEYL